VPSPGAVAGGVVLYGVWDYRLMANSHQIFLTQDPYKVNLLASLMAWSGRFKGGLSKKESLNFYDTKNIRLFAYLGLGFQCRFFSGTQQYSHAYSFP